MPDDKCERCGRVYGEKQARKITIDERASFWFLGLFFGGVAAWFATLIALVAVYEESMSMLEYSLIPLPVLIIGFGLGLYMKRRIGKLNSLEGTEQCSTDSPHQ